MSVNDVCIHPLTQRCLYSHLQENVKQNKGRFTTTKSPIDTRGDGWDLECNAPTKGRLPLSPKRRDALGLLDIVLQLKEPAKPGLNAVEVGQRCTNTQRSPQIARVNHHEFK